MGAPVTSGAFGQSERVTQADAHRPDGEPATPPPDRVPVQLRDTTGPQATHDEARRLVVAGHPVRPPILDEQQRCRQPAVVAQRDLDRYALAPMDVPCDGGAPDGDARTGDARGDDRERGEGDDGATDDVQLVDAEEPPQGPCCDGDPAQRDAPCGQHQPDGIGTEPSRLSMTSPAVRSCSCASADRIIRCDRTGRARRLTSSAVT